MVADIHGARGARQWIQEQARSLAAEALVVCGDISNFGPVEYVRSFLEDMPLPCLAVPGNCDPRESVGVLEAFQVSLHDKVRDLGGLKFVGLGGSNPTPFGTPFELPEEEILARLEAIMAYESVLVTHAPPKGHVDLLPHSGQHVGSTAIAQVVEEFAPSLVLCGHIHEARGAEVGTTTFVNPGPARDGFSAMVEADRGSTRVELLDRGRRGR